MSDRRVAYVDGRIVPHDEAALPIRDAGVLYGVGVFETLRVYDGVPLALPEHVARLTRGAAGFDIAMPDVDVREILDDLVARNALPDAMVRIILTAGDLATWGPPRLVVEVSPLPSPIPESGVAVLLETVDDRDSGRKSLCYADNALARRRARKAGADETVLCDRVGRILEGSSSNVFVVIDGALVTAPLDRHVLAGVTRGIVLEIAREMGIACIERHPSVSELDAADEAFLTSSIREIAPIHTMGIHRLVCPGPVTGRIRSGFRSLVARRVADARAGR